MVECRTPEREVGGLKPTAAVLCPWARHFTPRKYWLITQEAVDLSRHDWKIVDRGVKPQHKQTNKKQVPVNQIKYCEKYVKFKGKTYRKLGNGQNVFMRNAPITIHKHIKLFHLQGSRCPAPNAPNAQKKFHLARLFFIWRKRLAHTFFADIFIFFFVISGMNCASG